MKKLILIIVLQCISHTIIAQETANDTAGCSSIVGNIKFKNGIDTLTFTAVYNSNFSGNQDPRLGELLVKKQLPLNEYQNKNHESAYIDFMFPNCSRRFIGILNRKIYDRTLIRRQISDYETKIVNLNNLETSQKIILKCIVFEDKKLKDRRGGYFFVILELRIL